VKRLFFFAMTLAFFGLTAPLPAQIRTAQPPQPQDPYLNLMMSQPRFDTNSPPDPVALFDPPAVKPGELTYYRLSVKAMEQTVQWPPDFAAPKELQLSPGAHGQLFQMSGPGTMIALSCFNMRVRASASGEFTIPETVVRIGERDFKIPPAKLIVTNAPPPNPSPFNVTLSLSRTNAFVGEPVTAKLMLEIPNGTFQTLQQAQLTGEGLIVDQGSTRQQMTVAQRPGGGNAMAFIYETTVTPIQAGDLTLFGQGFVAPNRFPGMATSMIAGQLPFPVLLETERSVLSAKPLPVAGKLPGFTGAVGMLAMVEPPALDTNRVTAGEPIKLSVKVQADTNVMRLIAPPAPALTNWEIFSGNSNSPSPQLVSARHYFVFDYTLIPLSSDLNATPPIPFSYFDPQDKTYKDLTIPSVPITVSSGAGVLAASQIVQAIEKETNGEPQLALSTIAVSPGKASTSLEPLQGNAWFIGFQGLPAACLIGLWAFERNRRYLQEHPEVVLKRRARKDLRPEKKRIAAAQAKHDSAGFLNAAASALRIACSPHFPAHPRALVARDVLEVLGADEHASHAEIVRNIFAEADAAAFSGRTTTNGELLGKAHELLALIRKLEEKL
jgi:hypothetical protein